MARVAMVWLLVLTVLVKYSVQQKEVSPAAYLVTPPTTYTPSPSSFTTDCNRGDVDELRRCPGNARLTDGETNEEMDFDTDNFMGWNTSFDLEFDFGSPNYYITRVDIYYYNNPSKGYGLPDISTSMSDNGQRGFFTPVVSTFIDNSEVSQSDDEVQMLSLIVLTKPTDTFRDQQHFRLQFMFSSSYLATQTFISEMKFFNRTSDPSFPATPIQFISPNQTEPDSVQSSLSLTCTVDNNGTFRWSWTGPAVNKAEVLADTTRTSILMISNVSSSDAGNYICTAEYLAFGDNPGGSIPLMRTSFRISLILNGSVTANTSLTIAEDNNATLTCTFTGYLPNNYTVTWKDSMGSMENMMIVTGITGQSGLSQIGGASTSPAVQSNLTLTSVEVDDSGEYTCSMIGTGLMETITLSVTSIPTPSSTSVAVPETSSSTSSFTPSSTPPTPTSSASTDNAILIVAVTIPVVIVILILVMVVIIAMVYIRSRSSRRTMTISDSSNGLYAELNKPEPPPLPSRTTDNGGYASIDIPNNGHAFPMSNMAGPPPFSPQHTSPDRPTPAQITSKPNFLQPNPMYASSENLEHHRFSRDYLQPARSLPHIADADEPRELGSQFNIYAKPSLVPPPVPPPYQGTPEPEDGIFTDKEINPEALKQQSLNMDSSIYAGYRAIYSDPQPLQRSEDLLLEVKEKNIRELKDLGMGQFGVVVLAHTVSLSLKQLGMSESNNDPGVSLVVAIKRLRSEADEKMREMFEKEVKFMARLKHENVVRLLGVCLSQNAFIMMEYMENGDLNHYLKKMDIVEEVNPLPEGVVTVPVLIYVCLQIARGMCYLASLRFIHRDLATRNILVGQDFKVKIADFGMSQNLYSDFYYRIQGRAILPIRWMANECFYGRFSEKTDVWSFGVLMWEVFTLCRQQPFDTMTDQEVIDDAIKGSERMLPYQPGPCPNDVYDVMLHCWRHEPEERASFEHIYELLSSIHAYNDFS